MFASKSKPIRFDTIKVGKTLLHLNDGNYLELAVNALKIMKREVPNQDGTPAYEVTTNVATIFWRKEEIAQMEET